MGASALRISDLELDDTLVSGATKDCFDCDEDNPRAVPAGVCPTCGGTRRQKLAVLEIVEEIRSSKKTPEPADSADDDLYLEY